MTAQLRQGLRTWSGDQDERGHRTYKAAFLVECDYEDGPYTIMNCPGLPATGSYWSFQGDTDIWAICIPKIEVRIHDEREGDRSKIWKVIRTFTTDVNQANCSEETYNDPLLEPDRISGAFVKTTKEATQDRYGNPLVNSAWEQYRGACVEFDDSRPSVVIKQNVLNLQLSTIAQYMNRLNSGTMWGLPARCIKLSNCPWEAIPYGTCGVYYYTRSFEFDILYETFDRDLLDEGTKVLNGHWANPDGSTGTGALSQWHLDSINGAAPDRFNPSHFIRYKDRNGENTRCLLNGRGTPLGGDAAGYGTGTDDYPHYTHVEVYNETDLISAFGLPAVIGA